MSIVAAVEDSEEQPYQALYRRYRPQRFSQVRGQDHVTRALRNAVRDSRVAHAYLFSGPRGTGKTSTARILAMALNCEAPSEGEPDGTCTSCRSIRAGASMDVFELDAASNRKLDEMRDLLSRVALGTPGRWKVYIIDEVHQLTPDAASALLKTLEEPPGHVVFVLATTDPQKVLPTIQSRAQHFEFRLLDGDQLTTLLNEINEDAGLGLSAGAVQAAVQRARGSARDAESALEQLASSGGDDIGMAQVAEIVEALSRRDAGEVLRALAEAVAAGKEARRLGNDLIEHLRNAFLAQQAPSLLLLPGATAAGLAQLGQEMGLAFLVRCMETLGQALVDMRDSVDPRVTLEVALVRLAAPAADTSPAAIVERLERLERAMSNGRPSSPTAPVVPAPPVQVAPPVVPAPPAPPPGAAPPGAAPLPAPGPVPVPGATPGATPNPTGPGPAAQARAALGAILKGGNGAAAAGPTLPSPAPAQAAQASAAPTPAPQPPPANLPTRDELTKAWGDSVLDKLPRPAKVYMANGRFSEVTPEAAIFALPDAGLLARAGNFQAEAEAALGAHFGRRVPLRLVLDRVAPPIEPSRAPSDEETYDIDDFHDAVEAPASPAVTAEQRILEAFPGAVIDNG